MGEEFLVLKERFISYLRAWKLISKGCLYYLVWVKDSSSEVSSLQYIPIVIEFLEVFPNDFVGIPPNREIDFGIDILPNTYPLYINLSKKDMNNLV